MRGTPWHICCRLLCCVLLALVGTIAIAQAGSSPTTSCSLPPVSEEGLARPYCRVPARPELDPVAVRVPFGPFRLATSPSLRVGEVSPASGAVLTATPEQLAGLFARNVGGEFPAPLRTVPAGAAGALRWLLLAPAGTPVATLEGARIEEERQGYRLVLVGSRGMGAPLRVVLSLLQGHDGGLFVPPIASGPR